MMKLIWAIGLILTFILGAAHIVSDSPSWFVAFIPLIAAAALNLAVVAYAYSLAMSAVLRVSRNRGISITDASAAIQTEAKDLEPRDFIEYIRTVR